MARGAAALAGQPRQVRGAGHGGAPDLHARLWRTGQGSSSVVLKKIHNGGTHSPRELANQLDYLFSKSEWCGGNAVGFDPRRKSLAPEERREIVDSWSDQWTRAPKNGHTTHLLLSFPSHVSARKARIIAEDWAAEMFENPDKRGDQWAYVAALHTDRNHPHVHIVVQNRGIESGSWFYMAWGHQFDLQGMKDRVAEIAAAHGVALDTTSRVERGVLTYGPSRGEIEAARQLGRAVEERPITGLALETAKAQVKQVSAAYRQLEQLALATEAPGIAARMAAALGALESGAPYVPGRIEAREADRQQAARLGLTGDGDLQAHVESWIEVAGKALRRLSPAKQATYRPHVNVVAGLGMVLLGDRDGAELANQAPRSMIYGSTLTGDERAIAGVSTSRFGPERAKRVAEEITRGGQSIGLDGAGIAWRLGTGAISALEEREWVKADVRTVAKSRDLDLTEDIGRTTAAGLVDRFYEKADAILGQMRGIQIEAEAAQLRSTLQAMVRIVATRGQVTFESEADALKLAENLKARYGAAIIKDLARGHTDALTRDFEDAALRVGIARAIVSAAITHEPFGLTQGEARLAHQRLRTTRTTVKDRDEDRER